MDLRKAALLRSLLMRTEEKPAPAWPPIPSPSVDHMDDFHATDFPNLQVQRWLQGSYDSMICLRSGCGHCASLSTSLVNSLRLAHFSREWTVSQPLLNRARHAFRLPRLQTCEGQIVTASYRDRMTLLSCIQILYYMGKGV